ncbi:MAG: HIT family protein [Patescibacteria group bacterium]
MNCLFCNIAQKAIPAEIFYENDAVVAFLDIHPRSLGHSVIIPKVHAENIIDLGDEAIKPLFLAVKNVTEILDRRLHPHGFTIGINHGKVAGQAVDHVHVHVIPRYANDGGGSLHSVVNNPPEKSIKNLAKELR